MSSMMGPATKPAGGTLAQPELELALELALAVPEVLVPAPVPVPVPVLVLAGFEVEELKQAHADPMLATATSDAPKRNVLIFTRAP